MLFALIRYIRLRLAYLLTYLLYNFTAHLNTGVSMQLFTFSRCLELEVVKPRGRLIDGSGY